MLAAPPSRETGVKEGYNSFETMSVEEDETSSSGSDWDAPPKITLADFLNRLSSRINPTKEYTSKYQAIAIQIAAILEEAFSPDMAGHMMISGSFGKGTAIMNESDYDIVVFFSDVQPPYIDILIKLEHAIKDNADKFQSFKWKFRSSIHICFEVDGLQFDIAPATQYGMEWAMQWNRWCYFTPSAMIPYPSRQYQETLKRIAALQEPHKFGYLYSSSLACDAVAFVRRQGPFIHSCIRVAKYWAKHVTLSNLNRVQVRGKSLLMETITVHACYRLQPSEMNEQYVDKAFITFLELLADAKLRLFLYINYQRENIPEYIFSQTPLVLDPSNPFNNLLSPVNFPAEALKCFQNAARTTLKRLESWKAGDCDDEGDLLKIVELQEDETDM